MKKSNVHRKVHLWLGLLLTFLCLTAALSGVLLNHRQVISKLDFSRKLLPESYTFQNGNQAALRGGMATDEGGFIWFGDAGIWRETDGNWQPWEQGLPRGADARKTFDVLRFNERWLAATQAGLYQWDEQQWQRIALPTDTYVVDLFLKADQLALLTRNELIETSDLIDFKTLDLPEPAGGLDHSLFTLLWQLHSGELFGLAGKLFVDGLALILILLCLTGITHFAIPRQLKRFGPNPKRVQRFKAHQQFHFIAGKWSLLFLIVMTLSGMFLRPPLLIPIAGVRVPPIPGTHLNQRNPWHDRLRRGVWETQSERYLLSTKEGFFYYDERSGMTAAAAQPPVSVMGCAVLEELASNQYLVGSFSGLFIWNARFGEVTDFFSGRSSKNAPRGRPISQHMVTGVVLQEKQMLLLDYRNGLVPLGHGIAPSLPEELETDGRISLWNLCLEIHTGRIFEPLIGPFYILYVPLLGIGLLTILISGWIRIKHRRRGAKL